MFFQKTSIYNKTPETYSATHEKMTETEFRKMIEKAAKSSNKGKVEHGPEIGADFEIVKSTKWKSYSGTLAADKVEIVKNTIALATAARKEYEQLSNAIGNDLYKWHNTDRPEELKLKEYLGSLHKDDVALIEAIMIAGRDYMTSGMVLSLEKYMRRYDKGTIGYICGKAPLAEYLADGLKMYR